MTLFPHKRFSRAEDEQPCTEINSEDIDFRAASEFFEAVSRKLIPPFRKTLSLVVIPAKAGIQECGSKLKSLDAGSSPA